MIQIKRWDNGEVIHSGDFKSLKECLEDGVKKGVSFDYAELNEAKLNFAELSGAKLNRAELNFAKLSGAKLNFAKLNYAKLNEAELNRAELPERSWSIPSGEACYLFISSQVVVAGFESHSPDDWRSFTEERIKKMDGQKALDFYPRLIELMDFYLPQSKGE